MKVDRGALTLEDVERQPARLDHALLARSSQGYGRGGISRTSDATAAKWGTIHAGGPPGG